MQNGSIIRTGRRRGPDVWEFRWREPGPDGKRRHRRIVLGSVNQFEDRSAAFRATRALRRDINLASRRRGPGPLTLTELAEHYCQRELSAENQWKTYSTKLTYRGYLRKWIIPRWGKYMLGSIRAGEVELWLRSLPLARPSCAKIRNVMSIVFNHGLRYELSTGIPFNGCVKAQSGRRSRQCSKSMRSSRC